MDQMDLFEHGDLARPLTCPACGYTATASMHGFRMYHGWADAGDECTSMTLTRNHALSAIREGRDALNARHRKGKTPASFEDTMRRAIQHWGERAHDFIPTEHWPHDAAQTKENQR
jgi:hypothetical protein